MSLRDSLRRAASLIVELPPEDPKPAAASGGGSSGDLDNLLAELEGSKAPAATRTVEEIVRDAPGPNLDQIHVDTAAAAARTPDGKMDFSAIYQAAGLPSTPFSA